MGSALGFRDATVPPTCVGVTLSEVLKVLAVLTTALEPALALVLLLANSADRANTLP